MSLQCGLEFHILHYFKFEKPQEFRGIGHTVGRFPPRSREPIKADMVNVTHLLKFGIAVRNHSRARRAIVLDAEPLCRIRIRGEWDRFRRIQYAKRSNP